MRIDKKQFFVNSLQWCATTLVKKSTLTVDSTKNIFLQATFSLLLDHLSQLKNTPSGLDFEQFAAALDTFLAERGITPTAKTLELYKHAFSLTEQLSKEDFILLAKYYTNNEEPKEQLLKQAITLKDSAIITLYNLLMSLGKVIQLWLNKKATYQPPRNSQEYKPDAELSRTTKKKLSPPVKNAATIAADKLLMAASQNKIILPTFFKPNLAPATSNISTYLPESTELSVNFSTCSTDSDSISDNETSVSRLMHSMNNNELDQPESPMYPKTNTDELLAVIEELLNDIEWLSSQVQYKFLLAGKPISYQDKNGKMNTARIPTLAADLYETYHSDSNNLCAREKLSLLTVKTNCYITQESDGYYCCGLFQPRKKSISKIYDALSKVTLNTSASQLRQELTRYRSTL